MELEQAGRTAVWWCILTRGYDVQIDCMCCHASPRVHISAHHALGKGRASRKNALSRLGASLAPGKHCRVYLQDSGPTSGVSVALLVCGQASPLAVLPSVIQLCRIRTRTVQICQLPVNALYQSCSAVHSM